MSANTAKPYSPSWTVTECLEIPLKPSPDKELCIISLNEKGRERHGIHQELSIVPRWYEMPDNTALGILTKDNFYLNGCFDYRCVDASEIEKFEKINLPMSDLERVSNAAQDYKTKYKGINMQYIDGVLYAAIHEVLKDF